MFHPIHYLAVQRFLKRDVGHGRGRRGTVPVLLVRREQDDVAWPDFLDWAAVALHPAAAGGDNQRLTQRMGVPRRPRARLECDQGPGDARRIGGAEQGVDTDCAGEWMW